MSDRMTSMEIAFASMSATLGTKLDALIVAVSTQHTDHEARVRALEVRAPADPSHEQRIDALEKAQDDTHGPRLSRLEKALYLAMGGAIVLGGSAGGIVTTLLGG